MRYARFTTALEAAAVLGVAVALALGAVSCGESDDATPVACLEGKGAYLAALGGAPGEVRLSGEAPISECLVQNQAGGELAAVGATMVAVATQLNAEARATPGAEAAVQLGYLLGAAERGAEATEGIHADLIRRLEAAARYAPGGVEPAAASNQRAYERGYDAGKAQG